MRARSRSIPRKSCGGASAAVSRAARAKRSSWRPTSSLSLSTTAAQASFGSTSAVTVCGKPSGVDEVTCRSSPCSSDASSTTTSGSSDRVHGQEHRTAIRRGRPRYRAPACPLPRSTRTVGCVGASTRVSASTEWRSRPELTSSSHPGDGTVSAALSAQFLNARTTSIGNSR